MKAMTWNRSWLRLPAFAAIVLTLMSGPAAAQATPPAGLTDLYLASALRPVFTVALGETVSAEIVLENRGTQATTVSLYQSDYRSDPSAGSLYEEPGTVARSNAGWISLPATEVRLEPGARLTVPYDIRVPDVTDLAGSYWSVIMVKPHNAEAIDYQDLGNGARAGVRTEFRYAVTVVTNLQDSGTARLEFEAPQFFYDPDSAAYTLTLNLTNPGERLLQPRTWLELYDAVGDQIGRFDGARERIFPGSVTRQTYELGALKEGDYQAVIVADAGGEQIFAIRYSLNVETPTP